MKITYNIDQNDLRALTAFAMKNAPINRNTRRAGTGMALLISVAFASTIDVKNDSHPMLTRIATGVVFFTVMILFNKIITCLLARLALWSSLRGNSRKGLLGEHTITLTEDAVLESTDVNEAKNLWAGIHLVTSNHDYIYIFITQQMVHVIPRRAFSSLEESNLFLSEAKRLHEKYVKK